MLAFPGPSLPADSAVANVHAATGSLSAPEPAPGRPGSRPLVPKGKLTPGAPTGAPPRWDGDGDAVTRGRGDPGPSPRSPARATAGRRSGGRRRGRAGRPPPGRQGAQPGLPCAALRLNRGRTAVPLRPRASAARRPRAQPRFEGRAARQSPAGRAPGPDRRPEQKPGRETAASRAGRAPVWGPGQMPGSASSFRVPPPLPRSAGGREGGRGAGHRYPRSRGVPGGGGAPGGAGRGSAPSSRTSLSLSLAPANR